MIIRREKTTDIKEITEIHSQAFGRPDEGKIVENLRNNGELILSLVCGMEGKIAGHAAYSPIRNANDKVVGIALGPIGVLPSMQNSGIGSQLIYYGNEQTLQMGYRTVFVLGDPQYYARLGFELAREKNFYCAYDPEGDHFLYVGRLPQKDEKTMLYYSKSFTSS